MFNTTILDFLKSLSVNNNREWYHANKDYFTTAKQEFELFINMLIAEISSFDPSVKNVTAKESIFRIYRDTRFSKDKTPYKTNFGAFVVPQGKKSGNAGYYLHIEPDNCFVAGGIYMPPTPILKAVRTGIYENVEEFKAIITSPSFTKRFPEFYNDKLKSAPRDFPSDWSDIDLLKYKSYSVFQQFEENDLKKDNVMQLIVEAFKEMYPFNKFINFFITEMK